MDIMPVERMQEPGQAQASAGPIDDIQLVLVLLRDQWGITLWSARRKGNRIKLKMEASQPIDTDALHGWLKERFGPEWEIALKLCPRTQCCGTRCEGCLIGKLTAHR